MVIRILLAAMLAGVVAGNQARGRRLAVEHVLSMLAAGDSAQDVLDAYPFLEPDDIRACMLYAYKLVAHERIDPFPVGSAA